jgi:hypothetical protein
MEPRVERQFVSIVEEGLVFQKDALINFPNTFTYKRVKTANIRTVTRIPCPMEKSGNFGYAYGYALRKRVDKCVYIYTRRSKSHLDTIYEVTRCFCRFPPIAFHASLTFWARESIYPLTVYCELPPAFPQPSVETVW